MELMLLDAMPVTDGCWLTRLPQAYSANLSREIAHETSVGVVLVDDAKYDSESQALVVTREGMSPIVVGISDTVLILKRTDSAASKERPLVSTGDQAFLKEATRLPAWGSQAAVEILRAIRQVDRGQLVRGERGKFVNRPNNFWTITAQPQAKGFAITLYGRPAMFQSKTIKISDDRPGHSRFVIRTPEEISEAVRLILASNDLKS